MTPREKFEQETGLYFNCELCGNDKKWSKLFSEFDDDAIYDENGDVKDKTLLAVCCAEENNCPVNTKYVSWLEKRIENLELQYHK